MDGFRWLIGREVDQTRADEDSLANLLARVAATRTSPWRRASTAEALGVPAVFRAVSLIANTCGVLSMEGFRFGAKLPDADTPRLIIRPNPFTTPQLFWRDSAYHLARRGELWWWVAARDIDSSALSLIPVDPREVTVEANPKDLRFPIIQWRGQRMRNEDMRQITYLPDPNDPLRGIGPLQACGAAVSVSVEAQEWAANFFAGGGMPSVVVKSALEMTDDEAAAFKTKWTSVPNNQPRIITPTIEEVKEFSVSPEAAQLTQARDFQNGEVALMFGMPGTLLDHVTQGQSITYQNVGQEYDKFVRSCLWPNYLEPMEQTMSDLLTRSTVGRFALGGLLRADIKTRYDVYDIALGKGIQTVEEVRAQEGFAPGDVENRPVPFAPPQAVPASLPIQTRSRELRDVRCPACGRMNGQFGGPYNFACKKCGKQLVA